MEGNLVVFSCPVGSLAVALEAEQVKSTMKTFWDLGRDAVWEEVMRPYVYRVVTAPYPLCLSIASSLFPMAQEICVDLNLVTTQMQQEPYPDQWLGGYEKKKKSLAGSYSAAVPPNTYVFVVIPDEFIVWLRQQEPRISVLDWPAPPPPEAPAPLGAPVLAARSNSEPVPQPPDFNLASQVSMPNSYAVPNPPPQPKPPQSQRYLDQDDLSARVLLLVTKDLDELFAAKRRELEALEPAAVESVSQSVKSLTTQLTDKKLPALQLPEFRMEENKEVVRALTECVATSKKLKEEVAKLQERSKQW